MVDLLQRNVTGLPLNRGIREIFRRSTRPVVVIRISAFGKSAPQNRSILELNMGSNVSFGGKFQEIHRFFPRFTHSFRYSLVSRRIQNFRAYRTIFEGIGLGRIRGLTPGRLTSAAGSKSFCEAPNWLSACSILRLSFANL